MCFDIDARIDAHRSCLVPKNYPKFFKILRHIETYGTYIKILNINKNKNRLYSLCVNREINFLSLINLRLENICQIKTKMLRYL